MTAQSTATMADSKSSIPDSNDAQLLYQHQEQLELLSSTDPAKVENHFNALVQYVNGRAETSVKAKILASDFIAHYAKYYPGKTDDSINALLDLCEEDDVTVRVRAIRNFVVFCKGCRDTVSKMAYVLGQLLQTEDALELRSVKESLVGLCRIDFKACLGALFQQLKKDEDIRSFALDFFSTNIVNLPEVFEEENERFLTKEIQEVLEDVTYEEFKILFNLLRKFSIFNLDKKVGDGEPKPVDQLLGFVKEQADLEEAPEKIEEESFERFISCTEFAIPLFKKGGSAEPFFKYYLNLLFPHFPQLNATVSGKLLRLLVDLLAFLPAALARPFTESLHRILVSLCPAPEAPGAPLIRFTHVECVLYLIHAVCAKHPSALASACGISQGFTGQPSDITPAEAKTRRESFNKMLSHLKVCAQKYRRVLAVKVKDLEAQAKQTRVQFAVEKLGAPKKQATPAPAPTDIPTTETPAAAPSTPEAVAQRLAEIKTQIEAFTTVSAGVSNIIQMVDALVLVKPKFLSSVSLSFQKQKQKQATPVKRTRPTAAFPPQTAKRQRQQSTPTGRGASSTPTGAGAPRYQRSSRPSGPNARGGRGGMRGGGRGGMRGVRGNRRFQRNMF